MDLTNMNIESITLCSGNTGEKLMDIELPEFTHEISSINKTPKFLLGGRSATIEIEKSSINNKALGNLIGTNKDLSANCKTQFDVTIYSHQIRTHKKKRVNKKWAKRYGYKNVIGTYEGDVNIGKFNESTSNFGFEVNNLQLIKVDGKSI